MAPRQTTATVRSEVSVRTNSMTCIRPSTHPARGIGIRLVIGFTGDGDKVMIGDLVGKRKINGGHWALRAIAWTCLGCAALYVNTAALADQQGSKSVDLAIDYPKGPH